MPEFAVMDFSEWNTEELARRAQAGSSEAFDALADRYAAALRNYLTGRCKTPEDTEDIHQETLLRAWQNIEKYDRSRPFWPWLLTVARNLAANRLGARRHEKHAGLETMPAAETANPADQVICKERSRTLWTAAKEILDERQYTALWLRYGRDMAIGQTARAMGLSRTHVKVILFRARRRLLKNGAIEQWR